MAIRILSVGQCGVDGPHIQRRLRQSMQATVVKAETLDAALRELQEEPFDLVMVNRVLAADSSPGLDVVEAIKSSGSKTPVMLVSDREEAQREAVAAGAVEGFGKSVMDDDAMLEKIRAAIA